MLARTHFVFGILFGIIFLRLLEFTSLSEHISYFVIILLGVIIPDFDHPKISKFVSLFFSHRGFLHSIFPPLIFGWVLFHFFGYSYALPFFVGYTSHLIGDMLTVQGIKLFNPFFKFRIRGLLITGSYAEKIIFYVIIFLILVRLYFFV
ncbi:hypothetical protein COV11_04530 [Candidatus Woesearchaeota archaeon CG10_big_fil_rev_8_21_14_0_10_30_7]|nr:MAG: hypothetical protein COV11_04530 [Candidatus Woesearchaeota archaeon CG10_big_fil_rev_8_21_14_0_10_30_7]